MAWINRHLRALASKVHTHRKHIFHHVSKRSVILPFCMIMFMIASFGLIRQLPHPNDTQKSPRSYVIKFRNAAPFPVYFDLITIEALDGQGQGVDLGDDANIFRNVGPDEAEDTKPGDFEHVNKIVEEPNEEFNLRYEDVDTAEAHVIESQPGKDQLRQRKQQQDANLEFLQNIGARPLKEKSETQEQKNVRMLRKQFRRNKHLKHEILMERNKRSINDSEVRNPQNVDRVGQKIENVARVKAKYLNKKVTVSTISSVKLNKRYAAGNGRHRDRQSAEYENISTKRSLGNGGSLMEKLHGESPDASEKATSVDQPKLQRDHLHATAYLPALPHNGTERLQVVFLKVHKAASNTVFNIMIRFALSRHLDVMLPNSSYAITETVSAIDPGVLLQYPPDLKFDMICNHLVYNRAQISKFMKSPEKTVFIGILRDPFEQFVSAFTHYLNVLRRPLLVQVALDHPRNPIRGFLDNPLKYSDFPKYDLGVTFINNRMSTDLGFPMWNLDMDKYRADMISNFIKDTEENFHLVMVVELFEESLVLMRRILNWKVRDVLYIRQKNELSAQESRKLPWNTDAELTVEDKKNHKLFAPVDYALYEHFKRVLQDKIRSQEPDFFAEVAMLKTVSKDLASFCETADEDSELLVSANPWTKSFSVSFSDCKLMTLGESELTDLARKVQTNRHL